MIVFAITITTLVVVTFALTTYELVKLNRQNHLLSKQCDDLERRHEELADYCTDLKASVDHELTRIGLVMTHQPPKPKDPQERLLAAAANVELLTPNLVNEILKTDEIRAALGAQPPADPEDPWDARLPKEA